MSDVSATKEENSLIQQDNMNIGGYDKYVFKERLGINCLERYLYFFVT